MQGQTSGKIVVCMSLFSCLQKKTAARLSSAANKSRTTNTLKKHTKTCQTCQSSKNRNPKRNPSARRLAHRAQRPRDVSTSPTECMQHGPANVCMNLPGSGSPNLNPGGIDARRPGEGTQQGQPRRVDFPCKKCRGKIVAK